MYLLGDIGGTKTRLIFCKSKKDLKQQRLKIFSTPQNYREFLKSLKNFVNSNFHFLKKTRKAVFGFAGVFDEKKEKLIYAPNLKDYENRNLKKDLERILNCEVILENDAALAGIGEGNFGVGKNFDVFGYLTLSTGVGGVKIVKARTDANNKTRIDANSFGFEPGHSFIFLSNGEEIVPVEIEELIGGKNIEKIFGKKPEMIKDKKFWLGIERLLSVFLINTALFWSVEAIIIGGGMIKSLNIKRLRFYFKKFQPFRIKTKILKSKLDDLSSIYGGFYLCQG